MATSKSFDEAKWRAIEDMHTLSRAKEIEADRTRMAAAKREAEKKIKEMQKIVEKKPTTTSRKK